MAGHLGVRLPATPPPLLRPNGGGQTLALCLCTGLPEPGASFMCRLAENTAKYEGLMGILTRFLRKICSAAEASTAHTSPFCERATSGAYVNTSKTRKNQATAVVDDVRGHEERRAGRESTSAAESTHARRKPRNSYKSLPR